MLLVLPLSIVLLSVVLSPETNWTVRVALAGFCILAIVRPDYALLAAIALAGFGVILAHLAGVPRLRVTEALVAASLAGCFVRAVPSGSPFREALKGSASPPVLLFGIATAASAIVWQRVHQFETMYPSAYVGALLRFATREYFIDPPGFSGLVSAVVILEGLGLYVAVAALCRMRAAFFERALRMLALGGAGLATMSIVRLAEILLRSPGAIETLRATYAGLRISPQIPDYIAAGSYFSLCWLAALGSAMAAARRERLLWLAAGVPAIGALYLTGSRSVIAAALAGLAAFVIIALRRRLPAARTVVPFAAVAILAMVLGFSWMTGRDVAGETAKQSLIVRRELLLAGMRLMATRPVFGVGIDRFYLLAGAHGSPELHALWQGRMNPHNDFIRFGAELGLVGMALFLWILAGAGKRIWRALGTTGDARLAGVAAGLVAFLVTSMVSNPLMVREVSYVFWMALGLAVGHSARAPGRGDREAGVAPAADRLADRSRRRRWILATVLGAVLLGSIPFRAHRETSELNVAGLTYGLYEWGQERDGTLARWSGPAATVFVDENARLIEIPLRGPSHDGLPREVNISIDGRPAHRIVVGPAWTRVRLPLPPESAARPRRIDFRISPTWVPADVIPGGDRRELGVRVGEIRVVASAEER
jgi:O-antigen ligase